MKWVAVALAWANAFCAGHAVGVGDWVWAAVFLAGMVAALHLFTLYASKP